MIRVLILAAVALYSLAGVTMAADLPSRRQPPPVYVPPPPIFTWTGFYAGLNLGGGWSANDVNGNRWGPFTDLAMPGSLAYLPVYGNRGNAGGVVGGGQIGYNYQANAHFVLGAEADMHGTGIRSGGVNGLTLYPSPFTPGGVLLPLTAANGPALNWFGTVRGRVGFLATPTLLIYGTGGFAYGGVSLGGYNSTRTGWTAGGGVEWAFHPNWSTKLEYKYVDLSSGGDGGFFAYNHRRQSQYNVISAGVNYRFNFGGPAPVVARY